MKSEILRKINKLKIQRHLIEILTGAIAVTGTGASIDACSREVPEVCDAIISSVISFNGVDLDLFLNTSDVIETFMTDRSQRNMIITKKNLYLTKFLYLNVLNTNLEDLKKLPNLKELCLTNYKYLTDKDKKIIGSLNGLKTLTLEIDPDNINDPSMYDISFVGENTKVVFSKPLYGLSELNKLYYYNLMQSYKNNPRISFQELSEEEIEQVLSWQEKLIEIIKSFNFDENTTDKEKILAITKYVTDKIEYDPFVSNKADDVLVNEKISDYNNFVLGLVLEDDDLIKSGICCNYAALESALGYYANVPIDYTTGILEANNERHAWTEYTRNNNKFYVDPTFLDGDNTYNYLKDLYEKTDSFTKQHEDENIDLNFYKSWYDNIVLKNKPAFLVQNENDKAKSVTYEKYNKALEYNKKREKQAKLNAITSMIATLFLAANLYLEKNKKRHI